MKLRHFKELVILGTVAFAWSSCKTVGDRSGKLMAISSDSRTESEENKDDSAGIAEVSSSETEQLSQSTETASSESE